MRAVFYMFQVGSLRVVQVGGLIMVVLGVLGKFGAFFATIPEPVVGGILMSMFGSYWYIIIAGS